MVLKTSNAEMKLTAMLNFQAKQSSSTGLLNAFVPQFGQVLKQQIDGPRQNSFEREVNQERRGTKHAEKDDQVRQKKMERKPPEKIKPIQKQSAEKTDKIEDKNSEDKSEEEKAKEKAMEIMAQLLGIDVSKLQQMMDGEDATQNTILAKEGTGSLKDQLKSILEALQQKLQEMMKQGLLDSERIGGDEWKNNLKSMLEELFQNSDIKQTMSEIRLKLTEQGSLLKDSLNVGQTQIQELNKVTSNDDQSETANRVEVNPNVIKVQGMDASGSGGMQKELGQFGMKFGEKDIGSIKANAIDNNFSQTMSQASGKGESTTNSMKMSKEIVVNKQEVLHQIIEKAKVTLGPDKSEMTVQLKPDHLGKLSLQVLSERGAVVAKMTAESDQVKAIIESNLQVLKDELLKQGLTVESFQVSVGQEQQGKQYEQNANERFGRLSRNRHSMQEENRISLQSKGFLARSINPYESLDTRINLTA